MKFKFNSIRCGETETWFFGSGEKQKEPIASAVCAFYSFSFEV